MRNTAVAALFCTVALTSCGIDFVEVEPEPPTFVFVETEQREGLTASVEVQALNVLRVPVVIVSGDTLQGEVLSDGRMTFARSFSPDSLHPYIHVRIEPGEVVLDVRLPVLVRTGPAHLDSDGQLVLPVGLPETEQDVQGLHWVVEFISSDGSTTLAVLGSGALPEPLSVPVSLIPPEAIELNVTAAVQPETGSTWADFLVSGRVVFAIPDS